MNTIEANAASGNSMPPYQEYLRSNRRLFERERIHVSAYLRDAAGVWRRFTALNVSRSGVFLAKVDGDPIEVNRSAGLVFVLQRGRVTELMRRPATLARATEEGIGFSFLR